MTISGYEHSERCRTGVVCPKCTVIPAKKCKKGDNFFQYMILRPLWLHSRCRGGLFWTHSHARDHVGQFQRNYEWISGIAVTVLVRFLRNRLWQTKNQFFNIFQFFFHISSWALPKKFDRCTNWTPLLRSLSLMNLRHLVGLVDSFLRFSFIKIRNKLFFEKNTFFHS